ncbi:MAG: aminotransferase class V-fold PLP-dependent enzyme [Burkholderiaceae bacterium]
MQTLAPLHCQKDAFSIPADHTYLNSAYMGPLPRVVQAAGAQALSLRAFPAAITASDFFTHADEVRSQCAALVNAHAEHVALISTAAYGIAAVAKNLPLQRGQNIVLLSEQFPSNVYAWRALRERGVTLRTINSPPLMDLNSRAQAWNDAVLDAIDADTALVALEPAHWTDGTLFDLVRIGARAREMGAWLVVDATQTVGARPFDVQAVQPDALIVHSYKSMLCNYGLGFAVFSQRMAHGQPVEESWLTRAGSENFAGLVNYQDEYAPGMRRYDTSTRANSVLIGMLKASAALLLQWQSQRIQAYCYHIARAFTVEAAGLGLRVADEAHRAGNIFGVYLPEGVDAETVRTQLAQQKIHVSVRGSAVRVSPHVYNDEEDFARLLGALKQAIMR